MPYFVSNPNDTRYIDDISSIYPDFFNPGYYRKFIKDFSRLATPMMRLTRNEVKVEWNDLCEKAFQELKRRLTSNLILIVPERG